MKNLFLFTLLSFPALGSCFPVAGDRILGSDLATAIPDFAALPPTLQFGYAPAPGTVRTFAPPELLRLARINGISLASDASLRDVCFEVPLHVPDDTEFLNSLRRSVPRVATLNLLDRARTPIPSGRMEFPSAGLEPEASGSQKGRLWRGFVQYTDSRRVAIWVRVAISVTYSAVVARRDLAPDIPVDAAAVQSETRTGPFDHAPSAAQPEDVIGRILRRPLKRGDEIPLADVEDPPVVRRGDVVKVEVQSGQAVLRFDAVAQSPARAGELTDLRNPVTGKILEGRITVPKDGGEVTAIVVVGTKPSSPASPGLTGKGAAL